jgi:SAM-dependent methyltransferase
LGTVRWVEERAVADPDPWAARSDHPSRRLLERALAEGPDGAAWDELIAAYEAQASTWQAWVDENPHYLDALRAALDRGALAEHALEVCCGPGAATRVITTYAARVMATDASAAMIAAAPAIGGVGWQVADVRSLPFEDGMFDLVVGVNAIPWVPELARVTGPLGRLVWVSSFGDDTPLHVAPERLAALLGDGWDGEAGRVGRGTWCVMRRLR